MNCRNCSQDSTNTPYLSTSTAHLAPFEPLELNFERLTYLLEIVYNAGMITVTIPKIEYQVLVRQANAYRKIASGFATQAIETPVTQVVENFRATKKYSKEFLADFEDGLKDLRKSKAWNSK